MVISSKNQIGKVTASSKKKKKKVIRQNITEP